MQLFYLWSESFSDCITKLGSGKDTGEKLNQWFLSTNKGINV